jgi:trimethylamine:corrinoid methyltransferase-like protein
MLQECLFTDADFEKLREGVLRTLERTGMMFQNSKLLSALEESGARVDHSQERAWLPSELVEQVIASLGAAARDADKESMPAPPPLPTLDLQVAQLFLDWEKRERRPGNRADLIRMIQFADALHGEAGVGHCLLMQDVPPMVEPMEAIALLAEHAHRPTVTYPHYAEQFDYLAEMGEIWDGRKDRFLAGGAYVSSPLRLCKRAADFIVRRLEMGMECSTGTMATVGGNVPVTMAGAIVVASAEILGVWTAIKALRGGATLSASIAAGSVDMRTGNTTYCSPEAMRLNLGTAEFFRRLCDARIGIAGSDDYTDAKFPGLAAALQKAVKAMTVLAFTGALPPAGEGLLESGKTLSPEQLLIERDVTEQLRRVVGPIDVNLESLASQAIEKVGHGLTESYIECEHTLHHFRESLWHPALLDRTVWHGFEIEAGQDRALVDRAHKLFKHTLASYHTPDADPARLAAMKAVVARAQDRLAK